MASFQEKDLAEIQLSLDLSAANSEVHKLQQQKAELDLKLRQLKYVNGDYFELDYALISLIEKLKFHYDISDII